MAGATKDAKMLHNKQAAKATEPTLVEAGDGTQRYLLDGVLHNGPQGWAVKRDEDTWSYRQGVLHGPAKVGGRTLHYEYGKISRTGGPAIVEADGREIWKEEGVLHRVGGPAEVTADGTRIWAVRGRLHRENGPAIERADGSGKRYFQGRFIADVPAPASDTVQLPLAA